MTVGLTQEQRAVVDTEKDFLLLACPGSGKTRTAAARIARLHGEGLSVAACSYTNVGADRIASMLAHDHRLFFGPRNFNGTLHGLLLRYVVYPFAHLAGAKKAVRLWHGEWPTFPFEGDHRFPLALDQFRVLSNGCLYFSRPNRWAAKRTEEVLAKVGKAVIARKRGLFRKQGILSTDDAMWIALRILREQPLAAAALAGRFNELLIDEAQDTSDLQLACLHEIRASNRLRSLVLVGDLEQSIYAYQGASAEACRKLAADSGLETITLSQNHRSSQKLCDVAAHFSQREPDTAVGPNRNCGIEPELYLYPPSQPQAAVEHYRSRLEVHEISCDKAAVLARSRAMLIRLGGHEELVAIKPKPKLVGSLAAALASGTFSRNDVRRAEALLAWGAFDCNPAELDPDIRQQLLTTAHIFIGELPKLDGNLRAWILSARAAYGRALIALVDEPSHKPGPALSTSDSHNEYDAAAVFAPPPTDLVPQTVHALKGEDREAVMVVLKKHHGNDRSNQLQLIHSVLDGAERSAVEEEERRISYVALTRAERYCLLALPDDPNGRALSERCKAIGFVA